MCPCAKRELMETFLWAVTPGCKSATRAAAHSIFRLSRQMV